MPSACGVPWWCAVYGVWGRVYGVGVQGGYGDWVGTGRGYTGYLSSTLLEEPYPAKRARRPCRGRSGGVGRTYWGRRRGRLPDHPCGARSGTLYPPCLGPSECRLTAKGARYHLIFYKVSQNDEVSPKSVDKACHSPYIQKRLRKVAS